MKARGIAWIFVALASVNIAWAGARVNVSWLPSNSTDVSGYRIYVNGQMQQDLAISTATSWSGECPGCREGNNTIGVTAYDLSGQESELDVITVSFDPPPAPPRVVNATITGGAY